MTDKSAKPQHRAPDDEARAEAAADERPPEADPAEAPPGDGPAEAQEQERQQQAAAPEAEIAELKDKLLRALAENENVQRRARKDREDAAKYAAANFARDMLTVADNLHRALAALPEGLRERDENVRTLVEGIELTEKELQATLERHGIRRISPLGEKFNHDLHEALFEVPTADAAPGTVVQVVEDGYVIHDRLLRAARVGVAKAPPAGNGGGDGGGHTVDTTA